MKQKSRGMGVGTVSLIMIFSVLCLTVFAMLTLSTSNAEKVLADRTAAFIQGYYEADSLATEIMAEIFESGAAGNLPQTSHGVAITYETAANGADTASYSCQVTDVQDLTVTLSLSEGGGSVLQWKTEYSQEWEFDDSLTVWDGDMFSDVSDMMIEEM